MPGNTMSNKLTRFVDRNLLRSQKAAWRMFNDYSPNARPVFILGAQRSGTTILIKCLNRSRELEVHGEGSAAAMRDWRIRDFDTIRNLITRCRHRGIVFKPLTDSHMAKDFLSLAPNAVAIWMFRNAADRANSSVARFGPTNLEHLSAFVRGDKLDTWQAQGLSEASMALLRRFDYSDMSPHSASALFWYIRNALYFEQRLDEDARVMPLAYEDLVTEPQNVMRGVAAFTGCSFGPELHSSIHSNSLRRSESKLAPEVETLCDEMYRKLRAAQRRWLASSGISIEG